MKTQTKKLLIEVFKEKLNAVEFFQFSQIFGKMLNGRVADNEIVIFINHCISIGKYVEKNRIKLKTNKDIEIEKSNEENKSLGMFG